MGLLDALKSLLGITRKRDISRLDPAAGSGGVSGAGAPDAVEEVVNTSGGPLKPHHRRRALRDKRLLPKSKAIRRALSIASRKRVMTSSEADRLFGATLRTRNRNLRDLLADEDQLRRYGLPVWKTETDLAAALGISTRELWFFAIHRERERQPHYVTFSIPKRSGGKRLIMAPKRRLKAIQRKLLALLVEKLPVSEHAHAFRRGRSIRTGAEPHVGRAVLLRLDFKDFFPTITVTRVRGLLIAYGYGFQVATNLAVLMTEAERQPVATDAGIVHVPVGLRHCVQGAPTSPGLCNAITLRLDRRLNGLAKKRNLAYTRYADDLTFSGEADPASLKRFHASAARIIKEEGFVVNGDKTRIARQSARQTVTGVVVNKVLGLSRQHRRLLRAQAHRLRKEQVAGKFQVEEVARFRGQVAYLSMLNPAQAAKLWEDL